LATRCLFMSDAIRLVASTKSSWLIKTDHSS